MQVTPELLPRLNEALPIGRAWIGWLVAENYPIAKPVAVANQAEQARAMVAKVFGDHGVPMGL